MFHHRGQPRFSSGSEGEEEYNGKVSHRTGGVGESPVKINKEEKKDSNCGQGLALRVSPGIRGSLPRMSVDGENHSRHPK